MRAKPSDATSTARPESRFDTPACSPCARSSSVPSALLSLRPPCGPANPAERKVTASPTMSPIPTTAATVDNRIQPEIAPANVPPITPTLRSTARRPAVHLGFGETGPAKGTARARESGQREPRKS